MLSCPRESRKAPFGAGSSPATKSEPVPKNRRPTFNKGGRSRACQEHMCINCNRRSVGRMYVSIAIARQISRHVTAATVFYCRQHADSISPFAVSSEWLAIHRQTGARRCLQPTVAFRYLHADPKELVLVNTKRRRRTGSTAGRSFLCTAYDTTASAAASCCRTWLCQPASPWHQEKVIIDQYDRLFVMLLSIALDSIACDR